jgi:hypothetical protein
MPNNDRAFIEKMLDACHANISEPKPEPPEKLFHLTDTDGLLGILKGRALWSSLATSLNDCMEVRHALNEAEDVLRRRLKESRANTVRRCLPTRSIHPRRPERFRQRCLPL